MSAAPLIGSPGERSRAALDSAVTNEPRRASLAAPLLDPLQLANAKIAAGRTATRIVSDSAMRLIRAAAWDVAGLSSRMIQVLGSWQICVERAIVTQRVFAASRPAASPFSWRSFARIA